MTTGKVILISGATIIGGSWAFRKLKINAPGFVK